MNDNPTKSFVQLLDADEPESLSFAVGFNSLVRSLDQMADTLRHLLDRAETEPEK